jgi:hypothetical protein
MSWVGMTSSLFASWVVNADFSQHPNRFRVDFACFQTCAENLCSRWQELCCYGFGDKAQAVIILAQEQYISIVHIGLNYFTSQALSLCFLPMIIIVIANLYALISTPTDLSK